MASYELVHVDAFTRTALQGNACAVFLDAGGLDDPAMQRIAREMNLSESAFVFPGKGADFNVRYFTPAAEIPMAGHPTIATVHALREAGRIAPGTSAVTLRMPAGLIPVTIAAGDGAYRYTMRQLPPRYLERHDHAWCARALGLTAEELISRVVPQTVSTGTPQLMIALESVAALDRCRPSQQLLFPAERDYFSVHVFARDEGPVALQARHFAAIPDVVEDPFTGSATGGMAAYCARYGLVSRRSYAVAQGRHVARPGIGYVRVHGEGESVDAVEVGGEAVTVVRGTLSF